MLCSEGLWLAALGACSARGRATGAGEEVSEPKDW